MKTVAVPIIGHRRDSSISVAYFMQRCLSSRGKNMTFPWEYSVVSMPFHLKTIIISSCWTISHPPALSLAAAAAMSMSISSAEMAMRAFPPQRRAVVNLKGSLRAPLRT